MELSDRDGTYDVAVSHTLTEPTVTPMGEHDPFARRLIEESLSGIGMAAAGANVLVAGSSLFRDPDGLGHATTELRDLARRAQEG